MTTVAKRVAVLVCVAELALAGVGRDASAIDKARSSRAHVESAHAYFNLEKYQEAIGELEKAYLDKQDPGYFFEIAECHRMLGANAEAIRFYRRYLQETRNHPNRAKAEEHMAELERSGGAPLAAGAGGPGPPAPPPLGSAPAARVPPAPAAPPPVDAGRAVAPTTLPTPPPSTPATLPARPMTAPAPSATVIPAPVPVTASAAPNLVPANPEPSRTGSTTIVATGTPTATAAPPSGPIYERWWFWVIVGGVVAGGAVAGLVLASPAGKPACPGGVVCQ